MSWESQVGDDDNKIKWQKQGMTLMGKLEKQFDCQNKKWRLVNDRNKILTSSTVETLWNELESSTTMNTMTFILD